MKAIPKLENDKVWRLASKIALYAYSQLDVFPAEEEFGMQARLRERAFDMTTDAAEALGSVDPRDKAYFYGHALRDAYSVRNTLVMANKTRLVRIEPEVFVLLDELTEALKAEVMETTDDIPEYLKQFSIQDGPHED